MCGKGSNTTTQQTNQVSSPNPQAMAVYSDLLNRAQGVANTPYQPYPGQLVAPVNQQQMAGISNINAYQPAYQTALGMAYNAAQPISGAQINQYMSPYVQDVVNATQAQFNNTNAQQNQQVLGNAVAQHALGGNRVGIAQAELANQQNLAQAPVIAGLMNQGYLTGLNTALTEQQAAAQGAYGVANMANAGLGGANAQIGAGTLQQQTQQMQDQAAYQQYLNQLGYPFQTTQWLSGIGTGVGSQMGGLNMGSGATTGPPPNQTGQILSGAMGGIGLLGATGAFGSAGWLLPALAAIKRGGRVNFAAGGGVAEPDIPTIPETTATLEAQQRQLMEGRRRAQMFPVGTPELDLPEGMMRTVDEQGVFHHDPDEISSDEVRSYARGGRLHELLDLGPHGKDEVLHRIVHGGEQPLAVVERDPAGTEVRTAVGTHHTAPAQHAHFARNLAPGHSISFEHPDDVIAQRRARQTGGSVSPSGVVMPYMGGTPYIPGVGITPGAGLPKGIQPPKPATQPTPPSNMSPKNVGYLADFFKDLRKKSQSEDVTAPGDSTSTDDTSSTSTPSTDDSWSTDWGLGDGGTGYWQRGGGIPVGVANQPLPLNQSMNRSIPEGAPSMMRQALDRVQQEGTLKIPLYRKPFQTGGSVTYTPEDRERLGWAVGPRTPDISRWGALSDEDRAMANAMRNDRYLQAKAAREAQEAPPSGVAPGISQFGPTGNERILPNGMVQGFARGGVINRDDGGPVDDDQQPYQVAGLTGTPNPDLPPVAQPGQTVADVPTPQARPVSTEDPGTPAPTPTVAAGPSSVPRGIRNNNPGNIEDGPFARSQPGYTGSDGRFAVFETPAAGQAAGRNLLGSYGDKGLNTLSKIINRWAPAADNNDTNAYIRAVSKQTGYAPNERLDMNDPTVQKTVSDAMYRYENGTPGLVNLQNYNRSAGAVSPTKQAPDEAGVAAKEDKYGADSKLWPALMAAGAAGLSSRSPFLGVGLGEAMQGGLGAYTYMKEKEETRGLAKAKLAQEADKISKQADFHERQLRQTQMHQAGQLYLKQQELQQKAMEPKTIYDPNTGQVRVIQKQEDGTFLDIYTGDIIGKPKQAGVQPGTPAQPGQPGKPAEPGFRTAAFTSSPGDGFYLVSSKLNDAGPYNYGAGKELYVEKGTPIPEPAPIAGRDSRAIKLDAEYYLQTGKLPPVRSGASPVAQSMNAYRNTVQNYGAALAASRGIDPKDMAEMWRFAPRMAQFIMGADGRATVSLGTAVRHLDTLRDLGEAWKANDTQAINRIRAFLGRQFGDSSVTNVETAARIVGPEIIKALGVAGAGTEADRTHAAEAFSTVSSPKQFFDAITITQKLLGGQLEGKENQARAVGMPPEKFKQLIGDRPYEILDKMRTEEKERRAGKTTAAPATAAPKEPSAQQKAAMDWLRANPAHPKADAVRKKLQAEGVTP